jgi:hypothetical protein
MALTQPHLTTPDEPTVAVADPEAAQRAAEAHAAIILLMCLVALVAGTQLLVAVLGSFS